MDAHRDRASQCCVLRAWQVLGALPQLHAALVPRVLAGTGHVKRDSRWLHVSKDCREQGVCEGERRLRASIGIGKRLDVSASEPSAALTHGIDDARHELGGCVAKAVDRLLLIPHPHDILDEVAKAHEELELNRGRVLKFVNGEEAKPALE